MATLPKIANRAQMTVASAPGTGTISLGSASTGFQSFSAAGFLDGDVISYVLQDGSAFEIGQGTYSGTNLTLTRTPIQTSNGDGSAINASASATVFNTLLAQNVGISKPDLSAFGGSLPVTLTAPANVGLLISDAPASASNPVPVTSQGTTMVAFAATPTVNLGSNVTLSRGGDAATPLYVSNGGVLATTPQVGGFAVSLTNPFPVTSTSNVGAFALSETTAALAAGAVFTGATVFLNVSGGGNQNTHLYYYVYADQPGYVRIDATPTTGNWYPATPTMNVPAGVPIFISAPAYAYSYRVVFTNGSAAQTVLQIWRGVTRVGSI